MPLLTMASAASRMILSVTWFSHTYQLFHPMCGVSASVSPQTILNLRSPFQRVGGPQCHHVGPGLLDWPWIWPCAHSPSAPSGDDPRKVIGRSPVAGIVNRNGARMDAKMRAPLMRGVRGALGVRMTASSVVDQQLSDVPR